MKRAFLFLLLISFPLAGIAQEGGTLPLLQDLIRIDTSNPPGNEIKAAAHIRDLLSQEGIAAEIIESAPGRANLIARLKGTGKKPSFILLGHLDVVPADSSEWSVPPFSGEIKDGLVWGRGALDMKSLVAMEIQTFLKLAKDKIPLDGDVVLVLTAGEEGGGKEGAEFLVKNHWDKIEGKYLLNEGSVGVDLPELGIHLYPIQVAEKGLAWLKISAHGRSGHGSMPTNDNAVTQVAEAIHRLISTPFPRKPTPIVQEFLNRLADHLPFPKGFGARHIFSPVIGGLIQKIAAKSLNNGLPFSAVLSNTISPTMLKAGYKENVIPAEASAVLDGRILPGETPEGFRDAIQERLGSGINVELLSTSLPSESDYHDEYFRVIEEAVQSMDASAVTAPILSAGATDSRFFREKGVTAFGLIPLLLAKDQLEGLHGKNERVPANQLETGTEIVYRIVKKMQGEP